MGESLLEQSHYASEDIQSRIEELFLKWEELRDATEQKGLGLQQALSLVQFNRKVDGVESLIRDRIAVATSHETGRDLEHCQVLMKKFDDFQKVMIIIPESSIQLIYTYLQLHTGTDCGQEHVGRSC